MCAVPSVAAFRGYFMPCFPVMLLMYFLNVFEMVVFALIIIVITFVFTFHMRSISISFLLLLLLLK
jgi:hypothetical protein